MKKEKLHKYFMKKKIGVLMGGKSREREISLRSGRKVLESLRRQGFKATEIDVDKEIVEKLKKEGIEVAFVMLHGKFGEDGTVQGLLELLDIPYTGSGVLASALSMNKLLSKQIFEKVGIKTPPYCPIPANSKPSFEEMISKIGLPMMVKPVDEGSSIGVHILKDKGEMKEKVSTLQDEFGNLFVEKYIAGTTVTIGILGTGKETRALPILELVPQREFYDYEAKYTKGLTEFIIPARLSKETYLETQKSALLAHQVLGCWGFSRVDAIVDCSGIPYILEVNSIPGMTDLSDLPAEAEACGISYDELVFEILCSAIR